MCPVMVAIAQARRAPSGRAIAQAQWAAGAAKCPTRSLRDANDLARDILRKEVIQPQVPLRLPCYDFTPVTEPTVVGCLHCWLAHHLRVDPIPMV